MDSFLGVNPSPEAFGKWAKKREIFLNPDVAFLVPTKTMGLGVFACRPLKAGSVVISCPASSSISPYVEPSASAPSISVLRGCPAVQNDNVLFVVLRLMAELCRPHSPWRPWLEVCPRMEHHLFDLTEEQMNALGVSDPSTETVSASPSGALTIRTHVSEQLKEMRVMQRWAIAQDVMREYPELWPPAKVDFGLFCECLAQVASRNFHREEVIGREGPYLLPGLDIINHSFQCNARFEIRGGGRKHAVAFTVVLARDLQRGEQVYCSYGRIGVARFVVEFQFLTPSVLRENMVRFSAEGIAHVALAVLFRDKPATSDVAWHETQRDYEFRVDRLQRLGFLFDEGLYIVHPGGEVKASSDVSNTHSETDVSARWVEVQKCVNSLLTVFYLLSVGRAEFDELFHRITRNWTAPCTASLKKYVWRVLEEKRMAAVAQENQVMHVFSGGNDAHVAENNAARCQLLCAALQAEQEVLSSYQKLLEKDLPSGVH